MPNLNRILGDEVAVRSGLNPIAGTGGAQNGAWVDRTGFLAAIVAAAFSTSGGVTGGSVTVKLQDATDAAGTGAADFGAALVTTIGAGPNAGGVAELSVDLSGARGFIRPVVTSAPTGGTPASIVAALLVLGKPFKQPAV